MMKNNDPKIHAYLAHCGLGSRRQIEKWILEKKILVNGKLCQIGQRVSPKDKIVVNGQRVNTKEDAPTTTQVLLYHKKVGEICTRAEGELPTVFASLPTTEGRWVSVGRLDVNSSGLLLFTNNGQLANRLMHPKHELKRTYHVRVHGKVNKTMLDQFLKGMMLEGDFLKFESIRPLKELLTDFTNQWFVVTLKQGKNREVRRLFESQNCQVARLIRVQYGPIMLPRTLNPGEYLFLGESQLSELGV